MHEARVLVVDDSAAMRALFSDILDQARDVRVVGTAASADEARGAIEALQPNVVTLDVEMPGMSGIEFLEEIMGSKPLPVVMLSGLTQSGTATSLKAYELGAVECFAKPLKATPDEFARTVGKLGKIVLAAANSNLRAKPRHAARPAAVAHFEWNGRCVALSAGMGGIDALSILFAHWPAECPPTLVCLQAEAALAAAFIARLDGDLPCKVEAVKDRSQLTQGTIHITADPARHVIVEAGQPPRLRLVDRDPVDGARPSANLLFGTLARAAVPAAAAVLSGMGSDGARGLKLLADAGATTFAQDCATATVSEAPAAALAAGGAGAELALEPLSAALVAATAKAA